MPQYPLRGVTAKNGLKWSPLPIDPTSGLITTGAADARTPVAWVGASPPPPPLLVGQLWWRTDPDGKLFIWYDDGTSQQWVQTS
jgi:hypothetical protein